MVSVTIKTGYNYKKMTEKEKTVLTRETLIPIGVIIAIITPIVAIIVWGAGLQYQVQANKEKINSHESMDNARVEVLQGQVATMQNNQVKMDAKLDYIVATLDDIKKTLN